ncbi:hypothetical protein CLOBOL_01671 [Enterocloster bolteae ATCC BAA-613]|uniref:Uncharacterized protein n=1 Tax=Enterocloster bolteae (strain ATCC BAA-613 / DSM 15670 / CCUG 46953 / JCM 12243 / WAL 16351) TaxID=411902 RepID=A8RLM3_ENTBW|nr:hypothetical protein CLOBOL_01671 [Enterocloster bolteae ATCC BAA-613]
MIKGIQDHDNMAGMPFFQCRAYGLRNRWLFCKYHFQAVYFI